MEISNKESLKKENITLDNSINEFNEMTQKIIALKNIIENEINKVNNYYEKAYNEITKSFQKEYEILIKKENDLKNKLQNEVTKAKEKLENYLSQSNNQIKMNEKIIKNFKDIKNFVNKERNILKDLAVISKLNKTIKESKKLFQEPMKNYKFYYKKEEKNIVYEEYLFNEFPIFKIDEFNNIIDLNLNSPIKEDKKIYYDDEDFLNNYDDYDDNDEHIPKAGLERILNDHTEGEYDDEGFFITPNGSFWDPDGVYFNKEGYDKHGGYYDDNDEYIPGKDWNEKYACYEDEIIYGDYNEYASDIDYDKEENEDGFMNINIDSI